MKLAVLLTMVVAIVAIIFILGSSLNTNNPNQNTNTSTSTGTSTDQNIGPREVTIMMSSQNESGEVGAARINEVDGRAKITLQLTGGPSNISQPTHIHDGTCQVLGTIKYPLTTVRNGSSETILPISFPDLVSRLPLAISVHKSLSDDSTVSCGDIKINL